MSTDELERIAKAYSNGEFAQIENDLEIFLRKNAKEIVVLQQVYPEKFKKQKPVLSLEDAARIYLFQNKTIGSKQEYLMQHDQILKEAWYKGDWDHWKVSLEWATKYSKGWRSYFVLVVEYVFSMQKGKYLSAIEDALKPEAQKQEALKPEMPNSDASQPNQDAPKPSAPQPNPNC
jgi:hypothetical protein